MRISGTWFSQPSAASILAEWTLPVQVSSLVSCLFRLVLLEEWKVDSSLIAPAWASSWTCRWMRRNVVKRWMSSQCIGTIPERAACSKSHPQMILGWSTGGFGLGSLMLFVHLCAWLIASLTSSTAQGGGGSFKNRKPMGEVGCCESGSEAADGLKGAWSLSLSFSLSFSLFLSVSLSFSDYLPTYLLIYLSIYLSIYLPIYLAV